MWRNGRGHVGAWLLWWLTCFWTWMLLVGSWDLINGVAAAIAAALVATAAELAHAAAGAGPALDLERLRAGALAPLVVFADFAVITWALARSLTGRRVVRGRFLVRPHRVPRSRDRAVHRAWTILLAGYSPNAYVVDIDRQTGEVLVHDLIPWRRSEEPA
ncbi:MAG TPA: hypothetical protein VFQ71_12640 [Gaiellales bacterium]|nr:hypothetical protein [Gaiellales bacterium]